jgi:pimeloyl-ACP methyl ester carboxylesterase
MFGNARISGAAGAVLLSTIAAVGQSFPLLDDILKEPRTLNVTNNTEDEIKVCLYKPRDLAAIIGETCFRIGANSTKKHDRGNAEPYGVRVFLPRLFDKEIAAYKLGSLIPASADFTELEISKSGEDYGLDIDIASIADRLGERKGPHVERIWEASEFFDTFSSFSGNAPDKEIRIVNNASEKRKICFYNDDDDFMLVGAACRILDADEESTWDPGDRSTFGAKTFTPGIFDKVLKTGRHLSQLAEISIGQDGEIETARRQPPSQLKEFGIGGTEDYRFWYRVHPSKQTFVVARTDDALFIAIKGTDSNLNEHETLNVAGAVPVEMKESRFPDLRIGPLFDPAICDPLTKSCAHFGWWRASSYVYRDVERAIREMRGNRRVALMGHSMGGAVAVYVAKRMLDAGNANFPMDLVLFGAPRNGNGAIARAFARAGRDGDFSLFALETRGDWAAPSWPWGVRLAVRANLDIAEIGKNPDAYDHGYHGHDVYHEILTGRRAAWEETGANQSSERRILVRGDRVWLLADDYGYIGDRHRFVTLFEDLNPNVDADLVYAGRAYAMPLPVESVTEAMTQN